jgi:hypothetical protein
MMMQTKTNLHVNGPQEAKTCDHYVGLSTVPDARGLVLQSEIARFVNDTRQDMLSDGRPDEHQQRVHEMTDAQIFKENVVPFLYCPFCGESLAADSAVPLPNNLPPPKGYQSWLHYAVETIDTRSLEIEHLFDDGESPTREEMRAAVQNELRQTLKGSVFKYVDPMEPIE